MTARDLTRPDVLTDVDREELLAAICQHPDGSLSGHSHATQLAALAPVVARMVAEAADRPWRNCTGAGDCPESWHVHGCYADSGQCDDPTDHHDLVADAREAEVRERVEAVLREPGYGIETLRWDLRAALAPADNDGEADQPCPDCGPGYRKGDEGRRHA